MGANTTDARVASTTRRSMLGMIAGVPVAATFGTIALPAMADTSDLIARAEHLEAKGRLMAKGDYSDDAWDKWGDDLTANYNKVEALPNTPENARIRAKAIIAAMGEEFDGFFKTDSLPERLVRDIIFALAAH